MKNESEEVLCAEKDNVAISFANKDVRSFRIEAAHPVYLSAGMRDNFEADWTACDMSADPSFAAPGQPRKVTLYEETEMWVVGYAFPGVLAALDRDRAHRRPRRKGAASPAGVAAAEPTARRKCSCSIRRTAIGVRAR